MFSLIRPPVLTTSSCPYFKTTEILHWTTGSTVKPPSLVRSYTLSTTFDYYIFLLGMWYAKNVRLFNILLQSYFLNTRDGLLIVLVYGYSILLFQRIPVEKTGRKTLTGIFKKLAYLF